MDGERLCTGAVAPDFTLPDQDGRNCTLSNYRGHWAFLYFYPRDDTPQCTKEACAIRDCFPRFRYFKVSVLGVSPDNTLSHKRFAEKYHLPFSLLSDVHKKVASSYGAIEQYHIFGKEEWVMRISFLINLMGEIERIYDEVRPVFQIKKVLADLEQVRRNE